MHGDLAEAFGALFLLTLTKLSSLLLLAKSFQKGIDSGVQGMYNMCANETYVLFNRRWHEKQG